MYQLINLVFFIFLFFLLKKKKNFWNNVCLFCIVSNLSDYNYFIFVFIRGRTHKLSLLFVLSICDAFPVYDVMLISLCLSYRRLLLIRKKYIYGVVSNLTDTMWSFQFIKTFFYSDSESYIGTSHFKNKE